MHIAFITYGTRGEGGQPKSYVLFKGPKVFGEIIISKSHFSSKASRILHLNKCKTVFYRQLRFSPDLNKDWLTLSSKVFLYWFIDLLMGKDIRISSCNSSNCFCISATLLFNVAADKVKFG